MFLDTSGLYALLDNAEPRHLAALREFQRASRPFTHAYVLAELVALAQVRRLPRNLILGFVSRLMESGEVEIVWASRQLHEEAHRLLLARLDKAYSLCDAVSFIVMRQMDEREALTTDHHFEQEGLIRLLPG